MAERRWSVLGYDAEVAWLAAIDPDGTTTGFEVGDHPASVWILHSIYRVEVGGAAVPTHDEVRRERLRSGRAKRAVVNGVDLDAIGVATGGTVGFVERPTDARWRRLRWHDLAAELGVDLEGQQYPSTQWFPYLSWPANTLPPTEGSLDGATLRALVPHLLRHANGRACIAAYAITATGHDLAPDRCVRGPLDDVVELVRSGRPGTPSNFWPVDRSWVVYTDWDLSGTKVCGPPELISDLLADPDLETIHPRFDI